MSHRRFCLLCVCLFLITTGQGHVSDPGDDGDNNNNSKNVQEVACAPYMYIC